MRWSRRAVGAAGLAAMLAACGCGQSKVTATGKVTYNGKPVTWGNVTLLAGDGSVYYGDLKPDGAFSVDGVPAGSVKIGVSSPKPIVAESKDAGGLKNQGMGEFTRGDRGQRATPEQAKAWFPIPEKYSDPSSSGLTDVVSSGKPLVVDLK